MQPRSGGPKIAFFEAARPQYFRDPRPNRGTFSASSSLGEAKLRKLLIAPLCLITGLATVSAQSNYAVVRGSIFDPQHHAVAGAHIHAMEMSTGAGREVVSNGNGLYEIAGLQPGTYT